MSQDQNLNEPPRRFLRKGEGLKRFHAYKPPLPTTVKKPVERRQTFVRFRLEPKNTNSKPIAHFIPPEILNDDSINLSTEIPKIAPPKIIHTPIRPNRQALGTLTNESCLFSDSKYDHDKNIDTLLKKIEEKKMTLSEKNEEQQQYDNNESYTFASEQKGEQQEIRRAPDLSTPTPGSAILALGRQIQQVEETLNELQEKLKNCECGSATALQETTKRKPVTRAAARAAKSKSSDNEKTSKGPSANADNDYPIRRVVNNLRDEVDQLKAKFKVIDLRN